MRSHPPPTPSSPEAKPLLDIAVERLSALLAEENAALKDMDFSRAGALLQAKYAAAGMVEAALRADRPGTLTREARENLAVLARENKEMLQRAARIQKRVATLINRLLEAG